MNNNQIQIVRQSSLKFVNDYMTLIGTPIGMLETVSMAEIITTYVMNGQTKEVNDRLKKFDKFITEETSRELLERVKFELDRN